LTEKAPLKFLKKKKIRRYIKEDKLYPGELRIITALYSQPLKFTELIDAAKINKVTLSQYLKRLTEKGIVEHNSISGCYSFPKTFQPLFRSSFPDDELLSLMKRHMELATSVKQVYGKNCKRAKDLAQFFLFRAWFNAFLTEIQHALNEATQYNDLSYSQEYVARFSEQHLIPRLQLFMIEAFENKDAFEKFAHEQTVRLGNDLKENVELFKRLKREFGKKQSVSE